MPPRLTPTEARRHDIAPHAGPARNDRRRHAEDRRFAPFARSSVERSRRAQPVAARAAISSGRGCARTDQINIIAECKRRSPSRGVLRSEYDPVAIARGYERANAAALSVLTEPTFFDGALAHLEAVRSRRRSARYCARTSSWTNIRCSKRPPPAPMPSLLIVAALTDGELHAAEADRRDARPRGARRGARRDELDRALAAGATIVGVNNRNLRTLDVDMRASEDDRRSAAARRGSRQRERVEERRRSRTSASAGISARFLIGERFMTAADPGRVRAAAGGWLQMTLHQVLRADAAAGSRRRDRARGRCGRLRALGRTARAAIGIDRTAELVAQLPKSIVPVGVFVQPTRARGAAGGERRAHSCRADAWPATMCRTWRTCHASCGWRCR